MIDASATAGDFVISYDLNAEGKPHIPFLNEAIHENFLRVIEISGDLFKLPNTTPWGTFADVAAASAAFKRIAARVKKITGHDVVIEKFIITSVSGYRLNSDVRTKAKLKWTKSARYETSKEHQLNDPVFA